jgi:hypothetical protein
MLIAGGKFLEAIGKPGGKVQIKQRHAARTFLLAGCDKNFGNEAVSQQETRQNCPAVIDKNVAISVPFFLQHCIAVHT